MWLYTPPLAPAASLAALHTAAHVSATAPYAAGASDLLALERGTANPQGIIALTAWNDPVLNGLNRCCVAAAIPLVVLVAEAAGVLVGPGICGDETACLDCFARQRSLFPHVFNWQKAGGLHWPLLPQLIWTSAVAVAWEFISGRQGPLGHGWLVAARTTGVQPLTRIMRQPLCPVCSPLAAAPLEALNGLRSA